MIIEKHIPSFDAPTKKKQIKKCINISLNVYTLVI